MLTLSLSANLDDQAVGGLPAGIDRGIYYGWARVDDGPVHMCVLSIGWNPFFKNERRSAV